MDFEKFLQRVKGQFKSKLPFAIYSFPNESRIHAQFQKNNHLYTTAALDQSGFVMCPFDKGENLIIPESEAENTIVDFPTSEIERFPSDLEQFTSDKAQHVSLVFNAVQAIVNGNCSKIVVSRKVTISHTSLAIENTIARLFNLYPTAFRFICYHPETGLWCGASPEVLLKIENNEFYSMSLAGTRPFVQNGSVHWTTKEKEEQKLVSHSIAEGLQKFTSVLTVSKVKNHIAGKLVHLRTDFKGVFKKGKNNLSEIVKILHPTPAVCGTPRHKAKDFILKNEGYNREYYTGFIGPVKAESNSCKLFVNLRCMKISDSKIDLFVGGGITHASNPNDEYEETQQKLTTMLQVIGPMLR
ncbi:MAG: isochorismate synthase [Flavobacteriaceae bacterium]|nr:isochorismate synthase [Flavobacteriaceae bacterium]